MPSSPRANVSLEVFLGILSWQLYISRIRYISDILYKLCFSMLLPYAFPATYPSTDTNLGHGCFSLRPLVAWTQLMYYGQCRFPHGLCHLTRSICESLESLTFLAPVTTTETARNLHPKMPLKKQSVILWCMRGE